MKKTLVRLEITAEEEAYEIITGLLTMRVSFGWEEQSLVTGETVFRVHCENAGLIEDLKLAVAAAVPEALLKVDAIEEQDWLTAWKQFFTPVPCGSRFVVLPPWLSNEPGYEGRKKIVIEPKSAFGTGHHATTALCLAVLSDLLDEGRIAADATFLDLGTGSGVLGIGLCLEGLRGVGYDIDPIAVDNALENRGINGIAEDNFELGLGSIEKVAGRTFKVVVANILAGPLCDLAPDVAKACDRDGMLVLSGILGIQADRVAQAYMAQGLPEPQKVESGEWTALVWRKVSA